MILPILIWKRSLDQNESSSLSLLSVHLAIYLGINIYAIEISYFVSMTLLLIAKVLQLDKLYKNSVVFVMDYFGEVISFKLKYVNFVLR